MAMMAREEAPAMLFRIALSLLVFVPLAALASTSPSTSSSPRKRRRSDRDKIRKDLEQAALLACAIEEETPARLAVAYKALRAPAKAAVRRGALAAARLLEDSPAEGREALLRIAGRSP